MSEQFEVWNVINPPNEAARYPVSSPQDAAALINSLAAAQLKRPWVVSNAFGLEVFRDGDWEEWYDEDGNDIDHYCDLLWEALREGVKP